jgi:hypothetical protein
VHAGQSARIVVEFGSDSRGSRLGVVDVEIRVVRAAKGILEQRWDTEEVRGSAEKLS